MEIENPRKPSTVEMKVPMLDIGGMTLVGRSAVNAYTKQGGHGVVRHPANVEGVAVDEAPQYPSDTSSSSNPNY